MSPGDLGRGIQKDYLRGGKDLGRTIHITMRVSVRQGRAVNREGT